MPTHSKYSAESILKLPEMEAIRRSAGMYIGNRQLYGLTHIAWEIVSNAIDEATAGYGRRIQVRLRANGSLAVVDQGRGIPIEYKPDEKMSALALAFLKLHAGGKFEGSNSAYGRSGGMHGTGGKTCNAFSRWLEVEVRRHGLRFKIRFENGGLPVTGVEIYDADRRKLGEVDAHTQLVLNAGGLAKQLRVDGQPVAFRPYADPQTGTEVSFLPHRQFFDHDEMGWTKAEAVPWDVDGERGLRERFRQAAYLVPGVAIELIDERGSEAQSETFKSDDGLLGYLGWLNDGHPPLHKPLYFRDERPVTVGGHETQVTTEVALQYAGEGTHLVSFVNTIPTPQGGKHVAAFQSALTKAIKSFADEKKLLRSGEELRADDVLLGLTAIVNVTMDGTPQFQGQTKDALNSPEVHGPVFSSTYDFLSAFLAKNIATGKIIVNQAVASAHGRAAAQLARQAVMSRASGGLDDAGAELTIKKLADIQRRGGRPTVPMEDTELHLVEGDSAGGAAKQARDSARHGVLALRGKIPNIFDLKLARALENQEIAAILRAIGGVEASGASTVFNVDAMNFGRVCLLTDADVDGEHIRVLLMLMFWKLRPELIRAGRLFVVRPPLYKVVPKKGEPRYAFSDADRDDLVRHFGGLERCDKVQRYKGLGEMNAAELQPLVFTPEARVNQVMVTIEDAEQAASTFELLMGAEVEPRRNWLMETWAQAA